MKYKVVNQTGKKVKDLDLAKEIFDITPHEHAINLTVVAHRAAIRSGNADTKGRSEVRGGGQKPYRQKGTGRARQGTIRAPQFVGGGVVFGPTPRDYTKKVNRKVKKLAMRSALAKHAQQGSLVLVDKVEFKENKTKQMVEVLNAIGVKENKALFLDANLAENVLLSSRNITNLRISKADYATVYDVLNCKNLILTETALAYFEGVLK